MSDSGGPAPRPPRRIQRFQVSVKGCLIRDGKLLMVHDRWVSGGWELPGGRIDVGEESISAIDVLGRELREELGPDFEFTIGAPIMTWMRPLGEEFVFLVGYRCPVLRGEPVLSAEHDALRWVTRESWETLDLASGYPAALRTFWESFPEP